MSAAAPLIDQVAVKDTELLDWFETEVIACNSHPMGWAIMWAAEDNEPATPDTVLFKTDSFREALAQAKARQEAEIEASRVPLRLDHAEGAGSE
jgi:hypothetical protein